jgi:hypothetical protein
MMEVMRDQLRETTGIDLSELAGAHASGEIPLPDGLLNRIIAERLAARQTPIEAVHLESRPENAFLVRVRPRSGWLPALTLEAAITGQPALPESAVLTLHWSVTGLGFLARLAGPALALVDALPPGIRVEGDRAEIDLSELLRAQGHDDVLPLVRHLEVLTEPGRVVVRFAVRI